MIIYLFKFFINKYNMDDAKIVFQGRKTVLEMLKDRGYNIPEEYNNLSRKSG